MYLQKDVREFQQQNKDFESTCDCNFVWSKSKSINFCESYKKLEHIATLN